MNLESSMLRLRRANPVATEVVTNDELLNTIVATPGDRRLGHSAFGLGRRSWQRLAVLAAALFVGVGAAWAASGGALELFRSNPQAEPSDPTSLWNQQVMPESVRRAAVLEIAHHGRVEFWSGETRQGGWCGAVRLADGRWAGTEGTDGGTAPGCYPTREQINGDDPVFQITGFDYYEVQVDARDEGGMFWRVYYGVISARRPVTKIVDEVSGREAAVAGGEAFVIAVPDPDPDRIVPPSGYALDLVALDAQGEVVTREHPAQR